MLPKLNSRCLPCWEVSAWVCAVQSGSFCSGSPRGQLTAANCAKRLATNSAISSGRPLCIRCTCLRNKLSAPFVKKHIRPNTTYRMPCVGKYLYKCVPHLNPPHTGDKFTYDFGVQFPVPGCFYFFYGGRKKSRCKSKRKNRVHYMSMMSENDYFLSDVRQWYCNH